MTSNGHYELSEARHGQLSWGQAVKRFVFSRKHILLKLMLLAVVGGEPAEVALELVPGVDGLEDIGIAGVLLRLFVVIYRIKKNGATYG